MIGVALTRSPVVIGVPVTCCGVFRAFLSPCHRSCLSALAVPPRALDRRSRAQV